jgi:hypothetical protein
MRVAVGSTNSSEQAVWVEVKDGETAYAELDFPTGTARIHGEVNVPESHGLAYVAACYPGAMGTVWIKRYIEEDNHYAFEDLPAVEVSLVVGTREQYTHAPALSFRTRVYATLAEGEDRALDIDLTLGVPVILRLPKGFVPDAVVAHRASVPLPGDKAAFEQFLTSADFDEGVQFATATVVVPEQGEAVEACFE